MVSKHRRALQRLWKDRCAIYGQEKMRDPETKLTEFVEVVRLQDVPCKLSFSTLAAADGDGAAVVAQTVKLFLGSEIVIPAGSKIVVTRPGGAVFTYAQSGYPAIFTDHQEILLTLWEGYA